jgi:hypothetical protein
MTDDLRTWFVFLRAIRRFKEETSIARGWNDHNRIWWKLHSLAELHEQRPYYIIDGIRGPELIMKDPSVKNE